MDMVLASCYAKCALIEIFTKRLAKGQRVTQVPFSFILANLEKEMINISLIFSDEEVLEICSDMIGGDVDG